MAKTKRAKKDKGTIGKEGIGMLYAPETLFLRNDVGTASGNGQTYEMTTNFGNMAPIIRSRQTGKWFVLPWQEIIELAVKAGIDD